MRILGLLKADKDSKPALPQALIERMGTFVEEITKAGVMLGSEGLQPTSKGKRVRLAKGKVTLIDGPFAESKEVIASYALFQVASMDEAIKWTTRFLEVLGQGECELRPIYEASDFPADVLSPEQAAHEETVRREMLKNAAKR